MSAMEKQFFRNCELFQKSNYYFKKKLRAFIHIAPIPLKLPNKPPFLKSYVKLATCSTLF